MSDCAVLSGTASTRLFSNGKLEAEKPFTLRSMALLRPEGLLDCTREGLAQLRAEALGELEADQRSPSRRLGEQRLPPPFTVVRARGHASSSCATSMPRPMNIVCVRPLLTSPLNMMRPVTPFTFGTALSFARAPACTEC